MASCTLVIPCYNEAGNLKQLISDAATLTAGGQFEFVFVDNGSEDATPQILEDSLRNSSTMRWTRLDNNQGYGGGILAGLSACNTPLVGWMHADLQTKPSDILAMPASWLEKSHTFIKGRRRSRPLTDRIFTGGMSIVETILFRTRLWDINAQPTIFPRDWILGWSNPPRDFSLDLYVFIQARKCGATVSRFEVPFGPRFSGSSSWNTGLKSRIRFVRRTLSFSFRLARNYAQNSSPS